MKCSNCGAPAPTGLCVLCSMSRDSLYMANGKFISDYCAPGQIDSEISKANKSIISDFRFEKPFKNNNDW